MRALGQFSLCNMLLVVVFHWTLSNGLNQLSICPPFSFPHDCYMYILYFPILHLVLTFPFFSYFLSYILGYILWSHMASGHEVLGKAVSCWSSSSLLIALIIVVLFWVLNSDRLVDSFPKHRGDCPILNWVSTFQCVPILFVFLFALFWRELGRRDNLCRFVLGQRILTPGTLGMCRIFSAKGTVPSRTKMSS